jgi:biopolymer transport protein ExbD
MAANLNADDGDLGFQVAPMVDVVFVLMLFFLACALFQDREFGLNPPCPPRSVPELPISTST